MIKHLLLVTFGLSARVILYIQGLNVTDRQIYVHLYFACFSQATDVKLLLKFILAGQLTYLLPELAIHPLSL